MNVTIASISFLGSRGNAVLLKDPARNFVELPLPAATGECDAEYPAARNPTLGTQSPPEAG